MRGWSGRGREEGTSLIVRVGNLERTHPIGAGVGDMGTLCAWKKGRGGSNFSVGGKWG